MPSVSRAESGWTRSCMDHVGRRPPRSHPLSTLLKMRSLGNQGLARRLSRLDEAGERGRYRCRGLSARIESSAYAAAVVSSSFGIDNLHGSGARVRPGQGKRRGPSVRAATRK